MTQDHRHQMVKLKSKCFNHLVYSYVSVAKDCNFCFIFSNIGPKMQKEKNWDKVVVALGETEDDKPQGEAALNALFQQIYGEGSDDVRRAMNKSFVSIVLCLFII